MAITNAQILALPDYTDAEMVKLCKFGLTQVLGAAQSYSINGRSFTRANLKDLKEKKITHLLTNANELGGVGSSGLRKQDLIFDILNMTSAKNGAIFGEGVALL